jgi:anti-sigma-K factor RskA
MAFAFKRKPRRDLLAGVMESIEEQETTEKEPVAVVKDFVQEKPADARFRWLAFAAAIALLISLVINFSQYQQIKEAQAQIASLNQENQIFADQNQRTRNQLEVISSPLYQTIDLTGQKASPDSRARIYYSASLNKIYLNSGNLNISDEEKQFQLWAIIDGKPVDAGVFDPAEGLALVKTLPGEIQAFAVTLEPKGGSADPTLDQMYVLGSVVTG